jgi:hypothetical protein
VADLIAWLEGTALASWTRESGSIWAYPTILTLHTVGLAIVVGASAVLDVTLLGYAPRLPLPALAPLFGIIWWAFALNALTGVVLFIADATIKSHQVVFYVKLILIALALWNTALIRRTVFGAAVGMPGGSNVEPSVRARSRGRRLAIVSLLLWAAAITAGRLMAYL